MSYEDTYRKAFEAVKEFSAAGFKIRTGPGTPNTTFGILSDQMARARDSQRARAHDGVKNARALHTRDLMRSQYRTTDDEDRKLLTKLHELLDEILQSGSDADRLQGRAMRDMETAPSRNAFTAYEPGASAADRRYLARGRRLATRAADHRISVPFLATAPSAGSDLERMELEAARSFGMFD